MQSNQRATIEHLKAELQQYKDMHEQLAGTTESSAQAADQQKMAHLRDLIQSYKSQAQGQHQLLSQIQQEMEQAKGKLKILQLKGGQQWTAAQETALPACVPASGKSLIVLKERLSHQKQRLDEAVSKNKALLTEIEQLSKRGDTAKQLHAKLQRQLAGATAEAEHLQKHVTAVEEVQQQAVALAEQLRLQDDTEQLSFDAASKQLASLTERVKQQQEEKSIHASSAARYRMRTAAIGMSACTAAEGLQQLMQLLQQAGYATCCQCDTEAVEEHTLECCQQVAQQIMQLQTNTKMEFKQQSLPNMQVAQALEQRVASADG